MRTIDLMFENSPALDLTVGRSSTRQRILALLMDESVGRLHLREIQRRVGTSPGTASRELAKLVAAGLVEREAEGNQVYFRVATSPFATMLRSLLVAMPAPQRQPRPPRLPGATAVVGASSAGPEPAELPIAETSPTRDSWDAPAEALAETGSAGIGSTAPGDQRSLRRVAADAPPRIIRPVAGTVDRTGQFGLPAEPASAFAGESPLDLAAEIAGVTAAERTPGLPAEAGESPEPTAGPASVPAVGPASVPAASPTAGPAPETAASPAPETAASPAPETAASPTTPDEIGLQAAGRFAESVRSIYGEALRGVYLFGARASGPAPTHADVETIIVLDRVDHYGAELERTSHLCASLSHELDVIVSRVFVCEADWVGRSDGAWPAVRAEAVAV
jgi:DNA-binding transcriptional ArsR family regulator